MDLDHDLIEFGPDELVFVAGDYGQITLEGRTPTARKYIDAVSELVRWGGNRVSGQLIVNIRDRSPPLVENRHAGREGTPESGIGGGDAPPIERESITEEGETPRGTGEGDAQGSP